MNTKRGRQVTRVKLGTYRIDRTDLKNIEKIILKRINPSDHTVNIGKPRGEFGNTRLVYSSARYIKSSLWTYRYLELKTKSPAIGVVIKPYSTNITAQRVYSKGETLRLIDETVVEIENYFKQIDMKKRRCLLPNSIRLI